MMKIIGPSEPVEKPKVFSTRFEYLELEKAGLVGLPPVQGVFLSCHVASSQWHGGYPKPDGSHHHRAPKWAASLRSEREALLTALKFLWGKYVAATGLGKEHLALLDESLQKQSDSK